MRSGEVSDDDNSVYWFDCDARDHPMFILPLNFSEDLKRVSKNDAMINAPC
jgi:hypothetical protein